MFRDGIDGLGLKFRGDDYKILIEEWMTSAPAGEYGRVGNRYTLAFHIFPEKDDALYFQYAIGGIVKRVLYRRPVAKGTEHWGRGTPLQVTVARELFIPSE